MQLLNAPVLLRFIRKHRDAQGWLEEWMRVVAEADWRNIGDLRNYYPSADGVPIGVGIVTVFNVKGNRYRLLTKISYREQPSPSPRF